jgi:small-conductance mechanosensitive channel
MTEILTIGENIVEDGIVLFLLRSIVILMVSEFLVRMFRKWMRREMERRGESARTPIRFIGSVVTTLLRGLAVMLVLGDIKPLSGIGRAALGATSILALGVTFAAQEAFGNFIAGFFLAMYQPFRLGDLVTLTDQNITGTVEEITLRHTVIRTFDGTRIIVPNAKMNSEIVENKRMEEDLFSRQIVLSVAYDTEIEHARKVIIDCVSGLESFVDRRSEEEIKDGKPPVDVIVTEFLDSGIELRFRLYSHSSGESYSFAGKAREAILEAFRKENIEIPYPTRTVELRK